MEFISLNGRQVSIQEIRNNQVALDTLPPLERSTLEFIKGWISGQHEFSVKTSGSTGSPKTIRFSRSQMISSARRTIKYFNLHPGDTILSGLNPTFIAGMMMMVRALVGNLKLYINTPGPNPVSDLEKNFLVDFMAMTPIQVDGTLSESPEKFDQIYTLLIGGAGLHHDLEAKLQKINTKAFHSFAMSETLSHVAMRCVNGHEKSAIYKAMEGVSFGQDDHSCLIIHDKLLNIKNLATNDIVELIDKHSFRWIGRFDQIINTGGIKIQVEGLEKVIRSILVKMGLKSKCCILTKPDQRLTEKIILLLETREQEVNDNNLLSALKSKLPRYHDPKEIFSVPKIFLTKTGKIDRIRNADVYLHQMK